MSPGKPRVAFVVQRYGTEVVGGAESHCRAYAESLTELYDVDVLTSCALDYTTWANHYPEGVSTLRGVTVHRFAAVGSRSPDFDRWWKVWQQRPRTAHDELRWVFEQGPVLPGLLAALAARRDDYDLFIFFTYLYFPTVMGLRLVADKSILVPTANPGESPLFFRIFRDLFTLPQFLIYCTDEERDYCHRFFGNARVPHEVLGVGFETIVSEDPGCFRRQHGLDEPYLLFLGRIGSGKGCELLVQDFLQAQARGSAMHLVFAGTLEMALPPHPRIHHVGVIDGVMKRDALCGASAIVAPSPWDCLSIMACEAWAAGRPVLVTAKSPVVSSLCRRSGGGAAYRDADELAQLMNRLLADPEWAAQLGRRGREFLLRHYGRDAVSQRLAAIVAAVRSGDLPRSSPHWRETLRRWAGRVRRITRRR